MGGNSARGTPGGTRRFGPAKETGLARSEKIGSVMNVTPSMLTNIVEWPIHVMLGLRRIALRSNCTQRAAPARPVSEIHALRRKNGRVSPGPGDSRRPARLVKRSPCRGAPALAMLTPINSGTMASVANILEPRAIGFEREPAPYLEQSARRSR